MILADFSGKEPKVTIVENRGGRKKARLEMIGEIRDGVRAMYDAGRFEVVKEILGDIHPDNFAEVPDATVITIWRDIRKAMK